MAEVNIPALFDRLGEQMLGLSQTIKSQGVTLDVTPFDGKAKLNNVKKMRVDLVLRNDRLLLNIPWNKKACFGIQKN